MTAGASAISTALHEKFLANVAQLERMWRQQPPSARKAREMKAVSKLVASIRTEL